MQKLKIKKVAIIIMFVMFGGIFLFQMTGLWATESTKVPAKFTTGAFEGQANPEDIRGSYTFAEVSEAFEIDVEILKKAFRIPETTEGTEIKNKDLEALYALDEDVEIGNGSMKLFVALYKGLPYGLGDDYLFAEAVELIKTENHNLSDETLKYLDTHTITLNDAGAVVKDIVPAEATSEGTPKATSEATSDNASEDEENKIKGSTTFAQAQDLGLSKDEIELVIGMPLPQSSMSIRDFCIDQGLEFSAVIATLQEMVNQK